MFLVKRLMSEIGNPGRVGFEHDVEDGESFRMQAVMTTLNFLPCGFQSLAKARMTVDCIAWQ